MYLKMKSPSPLVSVIIPSYNHSDYICEAIDSVLSQTYQNIELIVIDDGSTDGSVSMLEVLSIEKGFKFLSQANSGVCKTLNRGIREVSSGEYICILASDDSFSLDKVEKQLMVLKSSAGSQFCYTKAREFDGETGRTIRFFPAKKYTGNVLDKIFFRQPYAAGSIMFTREIYDQLQGFDESLKIEDWDFSIRAAAITNFCCVDEPLFNYRSHQKNTMKTLGRRKIFQEKAKILAKNYMLIGPFHWFFVLFFHFIYDHMYSLFRIFNIKRFVS